ncbi:putative RNA-directed DNA polymerase from transposon X-element [Araneus ventricosus]|uniref:Putative RNA-directed DNA polymerase from transposon X-element n=1 Tax=Araneus ventricosus TaxID=182803 RepID=A0A4Y2NB33_ARAVE|nr:putative RNA-directed DNA polymerase from transposon X-element [Araneus ventricosus]
MAINFLSWNCHGVRSHIDDIKSILNKYQAVCLGLQEIYLSPVDTVKIKFYNIIRKDYTQGARASGGAALLISKHFPFIEIQLTSVIQAVAIQLQIDVLVTVCFIYLPPNQNFTQNELDDLINQLPPPFILMGDFNGHNPIWGSPDINLRGQQIETLIDNHCICLLNSSNHTYFHQPTRTFHTLDLALCSPSLVIKWNFNTEDDLFNSDHFPIILSYIDNDIRYPERPRKFIFQKANWSLFSEFATITLDMVEEVSIDDAVDKVTYSIIQAADMAIPKTSGKIPKIWKPWWNEECRIFNKQQKKAWDKFRRYPTTSNLIDFKLAKATFRRVKRTSQRKSWQAFISTLTNQISSKKLWDKIRRLSGRYNENTSVSFLNHNGQVITDAKKIANTLAEAFSAVSSASSYSQDFISHKKNEERYDIDFNSLTDDEYNSDFYLIEFKRALSKSHATSPGPDNIHLLMLTHLTETSLHNILTVQQDLERNFLVHGEEPW